MVQKGKDMKKKNVVPIISFTDEFVFPKMFLIEFKRNYLFNIAES